MCVWTDQAPYLPADKKAALREKASRTEKLVAFECTHEGQRLKAVDAAARYAQRDARLHEAKGKRHVLAEADSAYRSRLAVRERERLERIEREQAELRRRRTLAEWVVLGAASQRWGLALAAALHAKVERFRCKRAAMLIARCWRSSAGYAEMIKREEETLARRRIVAGLTGFAERSRRAFLGKRANLIVRCVGSVALSCHPAPPFR